MPPVINIKTVQKQLKTSKRKALQKKVAKFEKTNDVALSYTTKTVKGQLLIDKTGTFQLGIQE